MPPQLQGLITQRSHWPLYCLPDLYPTQPETGYSSLLKRFKEGALLSTTPCSCSSELREIRL